MFGLDSPVFFNGARAPSSSSCRLPGLHRTRRRTCGLPPARHTIVSSPRVPGLHVNSLFPFYATLGACPDLGATNGLCKFSLVRRRVCRPLLVAFVKRTLFRGSGSDVFSRRDLQRTVLCLALGDRDYLPAAGRLCRFVAVRSERDLTHAHTHLAQGKSVRALLLLHACWCAQDFSSLPKSDLYLKIRSRVAAYIEKKKNRKGACGQRARFGNLLAHARDMSRAGAACDARCLPKSASRLIRYGRACPSR